MNRILKIVSLFCALMLVASPILAKEKGGDLDVTRLNGSSQSTVTNRTLVNVGQVSMWIFANGASAITPGGCSGLFFPRGSSPNTAAIFTDGPIWGGLVNDGAEPQLRVGGGTYSIGTQPGVILSPGVQEDFSDQQNVDRIWRVRRDFLTADLRQDAAEFNSTTAGNVTDAQIQQLRDIYRADWTDWPVQKGAPFYDADSNGVYTPEFNADGSPKFRPEADEPGLAGADQVVWMVNNDLDPGTIQTLYGSPAIGMEVQTTLWAYARSDALGQIVFKQFRFLYKGTATTPPNATIDSLHFCQWSDPDLGSFGDDFTGSDTTLSLGYAYNSSSNDAIYSSAGLPPPASGYDFFAGPLVPDAGGEAIFGLKKRAGLRNLPMTTFGFFAAGGTDSDPTRGGDYNGTRQWWNLLRGFRPRPESPKQPWINPLTNEVTKFRVPGDPVAGTGWIDSNPGDRRLLLASGPFTMAVGDTQETVIAVMAALGSDRLSSVAVLKFVDRFAQDAFDNLFELANAPPKPVVEATEFDGQIFINWGGDPAGVSATEETVDKGYTFEGYNVYQLPTAGSAIAQSIKLATFDVVDEVTVISQETFDQASGLILNLPAQLGSNSGISRTLTVDRDLVRDLNLVNGQTYFFGVTAYNFNPDATVKTLESVPTVVTVVPQTTKPGVRLALTSGDTLAVEHTGISDGQAVPLVLDPANAVDGNYQVTFEDITDADGNTETVWNLTNVTSGEMLVTQSTNQSGDANYLITEGLQVVVSGPPLQLLSFAFDGPRWTTGGGHGGEVFFGGAFLGATFTGSGLAPAEYRDIMVDFFAKESFTDLNANGQYDIGEPYQLPSGAGQVATTVAGFGGGTRLGTTQVPFRAFDMTVDPPRQLDIVVRDRDQNGQWDLHIQYDPDTDPNFVDVNNGDLRFNYVLIMDTDYDETGASWDPSRGGLDATLGPPDPIQMVLWMDQRGSREPLGADFTMTFDAPAVNTTDDVFSFTSSGPTSNSTLAKQDAVELVNVFPNPYKGVNSFEPTRFTRFVTFNHLPQNAEIRIFNLAGIQVRRLQKNDPSQFFQWNLQNEKGLPVASGIYVAHIEMPDLGASKDLKLIIIQEQQFLRNF